MARMPLIYIAGPYRSAEPGGVGRNIERAKALALTAWRMGCAVLCPHANSSFIEGLIDDQLILEADRQMLAKCDALLVVEGWEGSQGTLGEIEDAIELGIPVFYTVKHLQWWLDDCFGRYVSPPSNAGCAADDGFEPGPSAGGGGVVQRDQGNEGTRDQEP